MTELDPRARFTATVDAYARWRPSYPDAAIEWLIAQAGLGPGAHVVDLGTGTGIVARLFAARGMRVTGIDPNAAMLERAGSEGRGDQAPRGTITYARGEATATGLPDASADLVVAAQAFHWFPIAPTLIELSRILRPGAPAAAMWNVRGDTPFMRDYEALLDRLEVFRNTPQPGPTMDALDAQPGLVGRARFATPYAQRFDREGLHGRAASSSYVAHASAGERAAISEGLDALFDAHQQDGVIEFTYTTAIRLFRFPTAPRS